MRAQDIMTRNPTVVTPQTRVQDAARKMKDEDVGFLPVVESAGSKHLVGVVTDRDIAIRCVAEGHNSPNCPVQEVMTARVRSVRPDDNVEDVMKLMGQEQVRRIPVVDERGTLVGVVAQADVVRKAQDKPDAERTVAEISKPSDQHSQ